MSGYPDSLARPSGHARLERATDLHARLGPCPPAERGQVVAEIDGDAGQHFTVVRGGGGSGDIAVYRDPGSGSFSVPTGRVFLRLVDGVAARQRETAIERAGYRIAALLDYAENAAWVEAKDGDIATALSGLDRLAAVEGVVNVEPQLLAPRALR